MPPADCRARAVRIPIRGGGEDMTRRKLSHVIAAGILAALLALPGPALAEVPRAHTASVWQLLAKLWRHEVDALLHRDRLLRKEGYGIDPNGGKPTGST